MAVRLFHLHFLCPDPMLYESLFVEKLGFVRAGRWGYLDGAAESSLLPAEWTCEEVSARVKDGSLRLRLTELRRDAVNVVFMPGKEPEARMEHFGFLVDAETYAKALQIAKLRECTVSEKATRTFINTPYGLRIELHVDDTLAELDKEATRISRISLGTPHARDLSSLTARILSRPPGETGSWTTTWGECTVTIHPDDDTLPNWSLGGGGPEPDLSAFPADFGLTWTPR